MFFTLQSIIRLRGILKFYPFADMCHREINALIIIHNVEEINWVASVIKLIQIRYIILEKIL